MFNRAINWLSIIILIVAIIGGGVFIWELGHNFVKSGDDLSGSDCRSHKINRISFHSKARGLDLNKMLDSFKNINKQYQLPDSASMETTSDCECCCIGDEKEVYFDKSPREIYWINIDRYRYNAGFEDQYYDDIGYLDIVSSYKNGAWHCKVTSKLDSSEKRRVRNRMESEIVSHLPIIKDTSSHKDEL